MELLPGPLANKTSMDILFMRCFSGSLGSLCHVGCLRTARSSERRNGGNDPKTKVVRFDAGSPWWVIPLLSGGDGSKHVKTKHKETKARGSAFCPSGYILVSKGNIKGNHPHMS